MTAEEVRRVSQQLLSNAGSGEKTSLEDVLGTAQEGQQERKSYDTFRGKEDRNQILQDTKDIASSIVVDPLLNITGAGLALTAQATDNEFTQQWSDKFQEGRYQEDMLNRGPDINKAGNVKHAALPTELAAFLGPTMVTSAVSGTIKGIAKGYANRVIRKEATGIAKDRTAQSLSSIKFGEQSRNARGQYTKSPTKSTTEPSTIMNPSVIQAENQAGAEAALKSTKLLSETPKGAPKPSSYLGDVLKTEAKINVTGTAGITPLYQRDEQTGEVSTVENPAKDLATGVAANLAFSLPISTPIGLKKAYTANKARSAFETTKMKQMAADTTFVNLGEQTIAQFEKQTGLPENVLPASGATPEAMKRLNKDGEKGVIRLDDGSFILNTEKMGTQRLYKDDKGRFYTKKEDGNIFTDDAFAMQGAGGRLLEPVYKEEVYADSTGESNYGFNSIRVSTFNMSNIGKKKVKWSTTVPDAITKDVTNYSKSTFEKGEHADPVKNSLVEVKPSYVSETLVSASKDDFIIPQGYDEISNNATFQIAIDTARSIRERVKSILHSDKDTNLFYTQEQGRLHNIVDRFFNANHRKYKNIIESLAHYNKETKVSTVKDQFNEALNASYDSALAKVIGSLKTITDSKGNTKVYYDGANLGDFANSVVNDAIKHVGIFQKGPEFELFKKDLANNVKEKMSSENLLGGKNTPFEFGNRKVVAETTGAGKKKTFVNNDSSIIDGMLDNSLTGANEIIASLQKSIENAKSLADTEVLRLSAMTNTRKMTVRYKPKKVQATTESLTDGTFFANLDDGSVPLYAYKEGDSFRLSSAAELYEVMSNTAWNYRGGKDSAIAIVDDIITNQNNEKYLARYLDIITDAQYKTDGTLQSVMTNKEAYGLATKDITALIEEAVEHKFMLESYSEKKGMQFGVMQVGTTRMQYTGYINPQQGVLSKRLFTTDNKRTKFKGQADKEKFFGAGVRTAVDEMGKTNRELLEKIFTQDELSRLENATDVDIIQMARNADTRYTEKSNPVYTGADKITESLTGEDAISLSTIQEVAKGVEHGDVSKIVAEYDAVTSMVGIVDMYLKKVNEETGVGAPLNKTKDAYNRFGEKIQKAFPFLSSERPDVKKPTQAGGYGQKPRNIGEGYIYTLLSESLRDVGSPKHRKALEGAAKSIKGEILLRQDNLFAQVDFITKKLAELDKTKDVEALLTKLSKEKKLVSEEAVMEASRLISFADTLETLKMKIESSSLKRNIDLDSAMMENQTIDLMTFLQKIESKKFEDVTFRELEAASALIANSKESVIRGALKKAFGDDFIILQDRTTKTFKKGYMQTREVLQDMKITKEFSNNVFKDLNIKGADKKNLQAHMLDRNITNAWDFIDAIHLMGYDGLTSRTIYDVLPKFRNGFGDPIPYVTNKGTGYHADTGMQYSMFSPINDPLPYLLHSTDSSLMAKGSKGQNYVNHRWDAMMDSNSFAIAEQANRAGDWMMRNANIYKTMEDAYVSQQRTTSSLAKSGNVDRAEIARDMARQEFALSGKKMDKRSLDARAKDILKELNDQDMIKGIRKDRSTLDKRSKDLENTDTQMQHYTNEDPATLVDIKHTEADAMKNMEIYSDSTQYHPSSFDVANLKHVEHADYTINELERFRTLSTHDTTFNADIESLQDGTASMYNSVGNTISLDVLPSDASFFQKLTHEVIHAVSTKIFKEAETSRIFTGIKQKLNDKGFSVGEKVPGKSEVAIYEASVLESRTGTTGIDPSVLYGNELASSMLDKLLANEIIHANKQTVAKLAKKNDISDRVTPLAILDRNTGKVNEIYTVNDLVSFLEGHGIEGYSKSIQEYSSKAIGIINASTHIKDYIYNKPKSKFETTIRGVENGWTPTAKAIKFSNEQLAKIDFLDLYKLDPEFEAVMTAINQTKGAMGDMHRFLEASYEALSKDMEAEFGKDSIPYERAMGKHWNLGINKLFYQNINGKFDFLNIDKGNIIDSNTGAIMEKTALKREFSNRIDKFFKKVEGYSETPSIKARSKSLKKKIKALANGSKGYEVVDVAKDLRKLLDITMGPTKTRSIDTKLAVQKIASMYAIDKHYNSFVDVSSKLGGHSSILDSYMDMANRHENPYSLFGDNVEMQFLEDGKTGRVMTQREFKSWKGNESDVIATGLKSADGEKYVVIKTDASERFIRRQPSELLTIQLSNFEKGVYEKDGIKINAQTTLNGVNGVDNGIVKQMTRNMYINMNKSVTKDVGYRQWQLLRDQRILMSKAEADALLKVDDRAQFTVLSKKNPYTLITGTQYYVDKRFLHYLEGDPGLDVRDIGKSLAGTTQYAKFVENSVIGLNKTVQVLANFILVSHPASYINSFTSSMGVYAAHIKGIPHTNDVKMAKSGLKTYRDVMGKFADIYMKDTNAGLKFWETDVKSHPIHKLVDAGVVNTIRSDMYKVASPREFQLYGAIHRATGNPRYANALKSLAIDPSTKFGNKAAEFFDYTELLPKVMLFENLKRNGMSQQLAAQKVMMAFPTYNNLPPMFNAMGVAVPFLKFFAALPKMMMYGLDQSPGRTVAGVVAAQSVVPMSYAMANEKEQQTWKWQIDNGFMKVPFVDWSYSTMSLFPLWTNPLSSPFGTSPWQADFALSAAGSIGELRKYVLPGTPLPEVKD